MKMLELDQTRAAQIFGSGFRVAQGRRCVGPGVSARSARNHREPTFADSRWIDLCARVANRFDLGLVVFRLS